MLKRVQKAIDKVKEAKPLDMIVFLLVWPLITIFSRVSPARASRIGKYAGALVFYLDERHRWVALRNLKVAFPHWRPARRWDTARRCFENVGKTFMEIPCLARRGREEIQESVNFLGWENTIRAMEKKKGVLFLTAHLGNWELMAIAQGYRANPPLSFIARPLDNPYLDLWLNRVRARSGNRIISKHGALRPVLRSLREGYAVGMLMDQSTVFTDAVFVEFFSHQAGSYAAMAHIALRTGVPVVPIYTLRDPSGVTHTVHTEPAVPPCVTGRKEHDVYTTTQQYQQVLERVIRRNPEQWFWMHRRWKGSPTVSYERSPIRNPFSPLFSGRPCKKRRRVQETS